MRKYFPFLEWSVNYRKADLKGDISAGLTVAVMLIPQGMAYALLAGLPPIIGLYASVLPLFVYALFGTSRQLAVGPVAMVSLLVASGIGNFAAPGSEQFVQLTILLALMVGIIQLLMGIGRMGFLVNFLSHPVISGFTSAAALIIGFSQLKHLLGVSIPRSHHIHETIWHAISQISEINPLTLSIGLGSIALLIILKRWRPVFPGALMVVVIGALAAWGLSLTEAGVKVVGAVPEGLPALSLPQFNTAQLTDLLPVALTIALVGFMESIAVAKNFAAKHRYAIDANQELVGLGLANIAGGFFSSYPVTGGFSRTAVNDQAGAQSGLASIISAIMVAITLLFLTPLFYYLPTASLAAIIMVAVFGLVDVQEARHLYAIKKADFYLLLLAFFATLILGIEEGILVSVAASLILVIRRTTRPHTAVLGKIPDSDIYRNLERYPEAKSPDGIAIIRIDAALYFANCAFLKTQIDGLAGRENLRAIVLDASSINDIDASADAMLHSIVRDLTDRRIGFYLANVKGPVRDVLRRSGLYKVLGEDHFFFSIHDAVMHINGEKSDIENEIQFIG